MNQTWNKHHFQLREKAPKKKILNRHLENMSINSIMFNQILKEGVVIPLIFPKVPQSSLGILRVPRLHPPLEHPLVKVN